VRALNACNQRGGRIPSLFDLLEDDSVSLPLAGYLPDDAALQAVESRAVLSRAEHAPPGKTCYVVHEVSPATYCYAYIWGRAIEY